MKTRRRHGGFNENRNTSSGTIIASSDAVVDGIMGSEGQKYEALWENPVWDDSLPLWKNRKRYGLFTSAMGQPYQMYCGGPSFQEAVWAVLMKFLSSVWTYKDVAERVGEKLGRKMSQPSEEIQSVLVPCHQNVATIEHNRLGKCGGSGNTRPALPEGYRITKRQSFKGERYEV